MLSSGELKMTSDSFDHGHAISCCVVSLRLRCLDNMQEGSLEEHVRSDPSFLPPSCILQSKSRHGHSMADA